MLRKQYNRKANLDNNTLIWKMAKEAGDRNFLGTILSENEACQYQDSKLGCIYHQQEHLEYSF